MSDHFMHLGNDFETPDARAKVTGSAQYAEDVVLDGMLHAKTVKSPYAHAYVESIDTSAAEAMAGVEAVLTYEDLPQQEGEGNYASIQPPLDREPRCYGVPVAVVAARDEYTAAAAVEAVEVDYRVLDHVIDPVEVLKPGTPDPRRDGNAPDGEDGVTTIKWDDADFNEDFPANPGDMNYEWEYGDVDAALEDADVVVEEVVNAHSVPQNPMEPRSNVAHWQNGTLYYWASSQSVSMPAAAVASYVDISPTDIVWVANYTGGGFGSKGGEYPQQMLPALLTMETNRPVKIRGTRKEEFFWGNGRTGILFKFRLGFDSSGRMTAVDLGMIADGGAYTMDVMSGMSSAAEAVSSKYDPENMRVAGVGVYTNTPKKWPHRGPGQNQLAMAISPVLDKAADELGIDTLELRRVNASAAGRDASIGADRNPKSPSYLDEALEMVGEQFDYESRRERSGTEEDGTLYGVGVGEAEHGTGAVGFDGLVVIQPDGTVEFRTGVGNLGTYSFAAVARAAAETLKVPWDQVKVNWGRSDENAFTFLQVGSNTSWTTSLLQSKAAETAIEYMQELAADELGGSPDEYVVEEGNVYHQSEDGRSLTYGEAADLAVEAGGKYSGEEIPLEEELNPMTIAGASDAIGNALVAFSKTTGEDRPESVHTYCASMAEVAIDTVTGKIDVLNLQGVSDCGTVIHPSSAEAQVEGGMTQGLGYALYEQYNFDEETGIPYNTDWYTNKTPTILDFDEMDGDMVDEPEPSGAHGTKGIGEPPYGSGAAAITSAVYQALGTIVETPITADKVLQALENGNGGD